MTKTMPSEDIKAALDKLEVLVKQNHDRASKFTPSLAKATAILALKNEEGRGE